MDALSRMIEAVKDGSFLLEFVVGDDSRGSKKVSNLLFAHDTLIFNKTNQDLHFLRAFLSCFEVVSECRISSKP